MSNSGAQATPGAKFKRGVFSEIFNGCGAVSRSLCVLGFASVEFDVLHGELFDIERPAVLSFILSLTSSGLVLGVWLAAPCTGWSSACRPALRTRECL